MSRYSCSCFWAPIYTATICPSGSADSARNHGARNPKPLTCQRYVLWHRSVLQCLSARRRQVRWLRPTCTRARVAVVKQGLGISQSDLCKCRAYPIILGCCCCCTFITFNFLFRDRVGVGSARFLGLAGSSLRSKFVLS